MPNPVNSLKAQAAATFGAFQAQPWTGRKVALVAAAVTASLIVSSFIVTAIKLTVLAAIIAAAAAAALSFGCFVPRASSLRSVTRG